MTPLGASSGICPGPSTVSKSLAESFTIQERLAAVISNDAINAEYFHMKVDASDCMLAAAPGQFFHLMCPPTAGGSPLLRRPMSIYRIDRMLRRVEFLYKVTGAGTRGLATLRRGDRLNAFGPLGRGFHLPPGVEHVLMVARGVGMATMAPLAEAAIAAGGRVTAVLSARRTDLLMSGDYLRSVGAQTVAVTDDDGSSAVPSVEALIRSLHAEEPIDLLATCGSDRLLQLVKALSADLDIPGQVALEQHMGCAVGMCFACVRPFRNAGKSTYKRVCCDGPVFDVGETISW